MSVTHFQRFTPIKCDDDDDFDTQTDNVNENSKRYVADIIETSEHTKTNKKKKK